jgi:methylglutaconyl-CoA hydratase
MPNPIADPFVEGLDTDAQSGFVRMEGGPGGALTITINRPERRNALNGEVIGALRQALDTVDGADGVRVLFIRGAGGTFSSGGDLEWLKSVEGHTEADNRDDAMQMAGLLKHVHDLSVLTVALIEGAAVGGGAGLVAACDMAIAAKDARFAFPEVKLGLIPATITPFVIAAIGSRRARGLMALGRTFGAEAARDYGLVDEVVDDADGLENARDAIAREVMACAPGAIAEMKRLVAHVTDRPIDHGLLADAAGRAARAIASPEGQEGLSAFLARHKPSWAI